MITLPCHQTIHGGCLSLCGSILEMLTGMLTRAAGRCSFDRVERMMWLKQETVKNIRYWRY